MIPSQRVLGVRSRILQSVRGYFYSRGFTEVETPVRVRTPALESFIDAEASGDSYLRTSPELHMKRLLCEGYERIFQVGPCFRKGEKGAIHNPEYTMLEWYRTNADYLDVLVDAKALVATVCKEVLARTELEYRGFKVEMMPVWDCITVREAFAGAAGWDPIRQFDQDRFDTDLVGKVEPGFAAGRPTVLKDFPAEAAALARLGGKGEYVYAERWELYAGGMELANAYSELTDPAEQRERFVKCAEQRRAGGRPVYKPDESFLKALDKGMPRCAGVALGIDRLAMLLSGVETIAEVRAFADE
ncbi:MAG: EF-P lysine aminoacylase GenX [Verrucomicrobia bacterium]|nr:EF-P lysine aminoacylase GenX [Verrucomicrobiota bacterium]